MKKAPAEDIKSVQEQLANTPNDPNIVFGVTNINNGVGFSICVPEVREHMTWAYDNDFCVQCSHPWYDGICTCGNTSKHQERMDRIDVLWNENNGG